MQQDKESAIKAVIRKRVEILDELIENANTEVDKAYYKGKRDGLDQAYDLLLSSTASIRIEL